MLVGRNMKMQSQFKDIFEAYGADYQSTMNRFMGNEKMYLKFLDMLFQDDNLKKLGTALNNDNTTEAFEAAHTLKGVIANMGLTPLHTAISIIVEPLRNGEHRDDYLKLYQTICLEFERADLLRKNLNEGGCEG